MARLMLGFVVILGLLLIGGRAWPPTPAGTDPEAPAADTIATDTLSRGSADLDRVARRSAVAMAGRAAYLDSVFGRDSLLRRWVGRDRDPIRVAITPGPLAGAAQAGYLREALAIWESVGLGLRFREVAPGDPTAELRVQWVATLGDERSGVTEVRATSQGRILGATITLALGLPSGGDLSSEGQRAVAVHEVGHAIGLPHSGDPNDVMFPRTRSPSLTARDRNTATLLYRIPAGSLRQQ